MLKSSFNQGMYPEKPLLVIKIEGFFLTDSYYNLTSYVGNEVDIDNLKWFLRKSGRLLASGSVKLFYFWKGAIWQ